MQSIHRNGDQRTCGATTIVNNQINVFVNGLLASVDNDTCSHGSGNLNARCNNVYINNKLIVLNTNIAQPDNLCGQLGGTHCTPSAVEGSQNVFIGTQ